MTDLNTLRASLNSGEHLFADTLAFIAAHYNYQPQAFNNGGVENAAGQNEGSCKTLGLALLERLTQELLDLVMSNESVLYAEVEVDKPHALRFAESVSITLAASR